METDSKLIKERLEVKNEITAGINKTPMALLINNAGIAIQKLTRSPKRVPLLSVLVTLALLISIFLGLNFRTFSRATETAAEIDFTSALIVVQTMLLVVVLTNFNIDRVLLGIRNKVIDFITSPRDLLDLHEWLFLGWSSKRIFRFFFWWMICVTGGVVLLFLVIVPKAFSEVRLLAPALIFGFLGGISFYYAPLMLMLPMRIQFYHYKLYESEPARSEVIDHISDILNRYAYGYVFLTTMIQISLISIHLPIIWHLVFIAIFGWLPLTVQFIANQACIRSIISLSKRKTLNRIQSEIQSLHEGDIKDKSNMETINRLMDYHERIRATPNSKLSIQSYANLVNQLVLSLFGFLLANIVKIIEILR